MNLRFLLKQSSNFEVATSLGYAPSPDSSRFVNPACPLSSPEHSLHFVKCYSILEVKMGPINFLKMKCTWILSSTFYIDYWIFLSAGPGSTFVPLCPCDGWGTTHRNWFSPSPSGSWASKSGPQTWWQTPSSPAESSY